LLNWSTIAAPERLDPMQSFFDKRGPRLDTSLPSVRHVQELIRNRTPVRISLFGGQEMEGTIKWQDTHFLALRQEAGMPLALLSRDGILVLRALA
jgi:host factor-I protein